MFSLCIISSDKLLHEKQDPFRQNYTLDIEMFRQLHFFFFFNWQTSQSYWLYSISFQTHMQQFREEKGLLHETQFSLQHTKSVSLKTNKQTENPQKLTRAWSFCSLRTNGKGSHERYSGCINPTVRELPQTCQKLYKFCDRSSLSWTSSRWFTEPEKLADMRTLNCTYTMFAKTA